MDHLECKTTLKKKNSGIDYLLLIGSKIRKKTFEVTRLSTIIYKVVWDFNHQQDGIFTYPIPSMCPYMNG